MASTVIQPRLLLARVLLQVFYLELLLVGLLAAARKLVLHVVPRLEIESNV